MIEQEFWEKVAAQWCREVKTEIPEVRVSETIEKNEESEISWDDMEGLDDLFEDIFKDF